MSGRNIDPHRIHHAVHVIGDDLVDASASAFRAIARGDYKADRIDTTAPDGETWESNRPEVIHARLERERMAPHALAVACQHAEPGAYCWPSARGLCAERISHAIRAQVTA